MEYIGNQPNPNNPNPYPYDDYPWWNYPSNWYDPGAGSVPSTPSGPPSTTGGTPTPINPDVDANGNPIFRTDVVGNAPPVETTPSVIGDPYLAEYLASLPQSQGGTGANFSTTGWDVTDWGGGEGGGDPAKFETTVFDTTDPDDPLSPDKKKIKTYWDFPQELPDYKEPFQGWPDFKFTPNPPPTGPKGPGEVTIKIPPFTPKPPPPKTQTGETGGGGGGGQQGQQKKPGVGDVLAALPFLAAFQGGTTTTPAPYAHLGPHTPVKPVFGPQGPGKRIPSIGQLLAGVR